MRIHDKIMTQEYAMARMLGYTAVEASLHVLAIRDDFRRICECTIIARTGR